MIYVTDTLRISKVDENCLQLENLVSVKSKKTGQTTIQWKRCGYYGDIKSALIASLKKQLFNTTDDEVQIKDVIIKIEQAERNINNAIIKNKLIE